MTVKSPYAEQRATVFDAKDKEQSAVEGVTSRSLLQTKSLEGPWSGFKDIAPPESKTYGSQSTLMLKIAGTRTTTVIFMGDIWKPRTQWNTRYLWKPLEIGEGRLWLPEPRAWSLDVDTGEAAVAGR